MNTKKELAQLGIFDNDKAFQKEMRKLNRKLSQQMATDQEMYGILGVEDDQTDDSETHPSRFVSALITIGFYLGTCSFTTSPLVWTIARSSGYLRQRPRHSIPQPR